MLPDPLPVKSLSIPAHTAITVVQTDSFAVTDLSPGRSVRIGTLNACTDGPTGQLTIAHSVSNENKPVKTDRVLIRFDANIFDAATSQPVVASAYLVCATPRGAINSIGGADFQMIQLIETLLGVVCVNTSSAALSETMLLRILAGEP
jgi:hypothetical protein